MRVAEPRTAEPGESDADYYTVGAYKIPRTIRLPLGDSVLDSTRGHIDVVLGEGVDGSKPLAIALEYDSNASVVNLPINDRFWENLRRELKGMALAT